MSHQITRALTIALFLFAATMPAGAQVEEPSVADQIRQVRSLVRSQFREILREELMLTEAERQAFWPLYERYSAEMGVINDRYLGVVTEYVDYYSRGELSDDLANRLIDQYFDVRLDVMKLRQSYVPKFRGTMTGIKVARFYQLENKVQAEVDAALASTIPLADPS